MSEGLNALVTTMEMVLIALFQLYAFSYHEYVDFLTLDIHYAKRATAGTAR